MGNPIDPIYKGHKTRIFRTSLDTAESMKRNT